MITGFKEYTHELTEYEVNTLLPLFLTGLKSKVGKESAITSKEMVKKIKFMHLKVSEPRVRKIIHHIRCAGLIKNLISTSKGYYISNDVEEIFDYKQSLRERISSINDVLNSFY
jgi:hypothetical protein